MSYQPSEVLITVHVTAVGTPTSIAATPSEIGTEAAPVDEGTVHSIMAMLTDDDTGDPIAGKILHFYSTGGVEITTAVTNANGQAIFSYTAGVADDMKQLKIAYLGD